MALFTFLNRHNKKLKCYSQKEPARSSDASDVSLPLYLGRKLPMASVNSATRWKMDGSGRELKKKEDHGTWCSFWKRHDVRPQNVHRTWSTYSSCSIHLVVQKGHHLISWMSLTIQDACSTFQLFQGKFSWFSPPLQQDLRSKPYGPKKQRHTQDRHSFQMGNYRKTR